jgi:hypothetical protein
MDGIQGRIFSRDGRFQGWRVPRDARFQGRIFSRDGRFQGWRVPRDGQDAGMDTGNMPTDMGNKAWMSKISTIDVENDENIET